VIYLFSFQIKDNLIIIKFGDATSLTSCLINHMPYIWTWILTISNEMDRIHFMIRIQSRASNGVHGIHAC
jgi:hypothetical protein